MRYVYSWPLLVVLLLSLVLVGCQGGKSLKYKPNPKESIAAPTVRGTYLDFEDVQVPKTLRLNRQKSYIYQNEAIQTGVLFFNSTRPVDEILEYFVQSMPQDNWNLVASFKFHKSILFFTKATKNCLIIVEAKPNRGWVRVEIWLSPARAEEDGDSNATRLLDKRKETP